MALTFGTLLSSQGADAQLLDPLGRRLWRLVSLYAVFGPRTSCMVLFAPDGPGRAAESTPRVQDSEHGVQWDKPPETKPERG